MKKVVISKITKEKKKKHHEPSINQKGEEKGKPMRRERKCK